MISIKFPLSSIFRGLLFRLVNHVSNENSELSVFSIVKICSEILVNYSNTLFDTRVNKT